MPPAPTTDASHTTSASPPVHIYALTPGSNSSSFRLLNEEWIVRHFSLEPRDRETLNDPDGTILDRGGRVYLARVDGSDVGCVALIPMGAGEFELSKMAVAPHMRGRGIGRTLLLHAIAEARQLGAVSLFLGSSTRLAPAVQLYESVGFLHLPPDQRPQLPYTRADVFMRLVL